MNRRLLFCCMKIWAYKTDIGALSRAASLQE